MISNDLNETAVTVMTRIAVRISRPSRGIMDVVRRISLPVIYRSFPIPATLATIVISELILFN